MARIGTAATVVGTAAPLIAQSQLDQTGDRSLTRISSLLGLGGGSLLLGGNYLMSQGIIPGGLDQSVMNLMMDLGVGLFTSGLYTTFFPKGAGLGLPSL